jgi:hypothetical protein
MNAFSSLPRLVVIGGMLLACSASSGPAGEVVGENGGSGGIPTDTGGASGSGGATSGTAGTLPGSGGTIPTAGSGGTAANDCGVQTFSLERKPAEVLLVLDRSASQREPVELPDGTEGMIKWDLMIPPLITVVNETDEAVSWGLKVFPEDSPEEDPACSPGSVTSNIQVEIAERNAAAVVAGIEGTDNGGDGTPTGDAIREAVAYLQSRESVNDYRRYILLATDGEPSCLNVTATTGEEVEQSEARGPSIQSVATAAAAGFPVIVVGVGTNKESAVQTLNDMASAGQAPAPCANPLDPCFYLSNTQAQLVEQLRAITTNVASCVFALTAVPPDPNNVRVLLDGEKIDRDMTRTNGWEYQDTGQTIIEVYGDACNAIKGSEAANVQIRIGCPTIDVR